jgi:ABC-2 type transport system ATP-binding protein
MIEIDSISKRFVDLKAVDNMSFQVRPGEILGFLGPNGAGKSTTMKMITGFLVPDEGSIRVCGHDLSTDLRAAQQRIGYLPEGAPCYEEMTPASFLDFIAEIRGFSGREKVDRVTSVLNEMALGSVRQQRIETLSKGFKRRVGLAQAIIHNPDVLVLDEPTDGLDPNQKHHVREMIRGLSKEKIVIISTHILEEVTAVCSRVMIIDGGKIVADCTPAELESRSHYHHAVTMELDVSAEIEQKLLGLSDVETLEINQDRTRLTVIPVSGRTVLKQVNELVQRENWNPISMYVERGRMDDVFRSITRGGL